MELIPNYKQEPYERKRAIFLFLQSIGVAITDYDSIPDKVHYGLRMFNNRDLLATTVVESFNNNYTVAMIQRKYGLSEKNVNTVLRRYKRGQTAK